MPTWLNGLLTAALSGSVMVLAQSGIGDTPNNWKNVGIGAGAGALVGIVNWLRTSPWKTSLR